MGAPLEFQTRHELSENIVTTMTGYGSHDVPGRTWSDDTSMTLATMKAMIDTKAFNYKAIMGNFVLWVDKADFTADGVVFDRGITCRKAILNYERTYCEPTEAGLKDLFNNGNGFL